MKRTPRPKGPDWSRCSPQCYAWGRLFPAWCGEPTDNGDWATNESAAVNCRDGRSFVADQRATSLSTVRTDFNISCKGIALNYRKH